MTAYIAPPPVKTNANYKGFTPTPSTHEKNHRLRFCALSEALLAIRLRCCVPNVIEINALEAPGRATFLIRTGSISVLKGSKRVPRYALLEDAIFKVVRFTRHCSRYFSFLGF